MWKTNPSLDQLNSQNCLKTMQETHKRRQNMLNNTKCFYINLHQPSLNRYRLIKHVYTRIILEHEYVIKMSTKVGLLN